jgi:hypothetical protein
LSREFAERQWGDCSYRVLPVNVIACIEDHGADEKAWFGKPRCQGHHSPKLNHTQWIECG